VATNCQLSASGKLTFQVQKTKTVGNLTVNCLGKQKDPNIWLQFNAREAHQSKFKFKFRYKGI
tara:strand:+ start:114 stop:302 length:189 start_codon:yes stop_codon:yes gene_type:complete